MEAASRAGVVFVAVFPEHHSTLVPLRSALVGKTVVDVSNGLRINHDGPSNAAMLADVFPESFVVKGFNTISAWTLQMGPRDGSRQVGNVRSPFIALKMWDVEREMASVKSSILTVIFFSSGFLVQRQSKG